MEERRQILELIESGQIGVEEGIRRLEALGGTGAPADERGPEAASETAAPITRPLWIRVVARIVFGSGLILLVGGLLLVTAVYAWGIPAGWQALGWPLFVIGLLVLILGWWLERAHWMSLRVRDPQGHNIALAFPLPLGLFGWLMRVLRPFVPQLQQTPVDELFPALEQELRAGNPLVVDVDDKESGERVQIYFG